MGIAAPTLDGRGWALLVALAGAPVGRVLHFHQGGGLAAVDMPPFTLVFFRVGIAALVLHAIVLARRARYPRGARFSLATW